MRYYGSKSPRTMQLGTGGLMLSTLFTRHRRTLFLLEGAFHYERDTQKKKKQAVMYYTLSFLSRERSKFVCCVCFCGALYYERDTKNLKHPVLHYTL